MRKRLTMAVLAGALMAAIAPGVALAGEPVGRCASAASGHLLVEFAPSPQVDRNGDGWTCYLKSASGVGMWVDNSIPLR